MNTITNIPQDISANRNLSVSLVNTQIKDDEKPSCLDLINESRVVKITPSTNEYNNLTICSNSIISYTNYCKAIKQKNRSSLLELKTKSQLHPIITNDNGSPDYLAINIYYDTLRSWYSPHRIQKENGKIIEVSKLKTKGIYIDYNKLSETYGCSKETIRRKLVKLEKLGLVQRSFKHKETVTTKSYNQLIIYVWRHTPHFFNKHGIDQSEVGGIKPQTNHEYITEKYNIDYHSKIEQIKAIESRAENRGGIHKLVDTKELIEPFNKLKDRSNESNFCKNNFNSKNTSIESNKKTENFIEDDINNALDNSIADNSVSSITTKLKENIAVSSISKNGFLGYGKNLKDLLEHLTDEMCNTLRSKCGKDYTDRAIREIVKAVSRSKKGAKAFFYHIKGFVLYLAKILKFEKRDPVKISSTNYYITANQTSEKQEARKQEKYLIDIEYSLQVSPEWHLKKKLAAVLERSKAYNVLTSYKSLNIKESRAVIQLSRFVELSEIDKDIILQQIQATHEKIDNNGDYQSIESLELTMPNKSISSVAIKVCQPEQDYPKREGVWGKIRESFAKSFAVGGDDLDKAWLSKLYAKIDNEEKTIIIESPSRFIKDWIENNYLSYIENAAKVNGWLLKIK